MSRSSPKGRSEGRRMKFYRELLGLKSEKVADDAGISVKVLDDYENEIKCAQGKNKEKIAKALGIPVKLLESPLPGEAGSASDDEKDFMTFMKVFRKMDGTIVGENGMYMVHFPGAGAQKLLSNYLESKEKLKRVKELAAEFSDDSLMKQYEEDAMEKYCIDVDKDAAKEYAESIKQAGKKKED